MHSKRQDFSISASRMTTFVLAILAIMCTASEAALFINITILKNAASQGAVCLDGTPPAYHFDRGFGSGLRNWIVFLNPGGWCDSIATCHARTKNGIGSSTHMEKRASFGGILVNSPQENPEFYNWNRVRINYCDGSSFTGDIDEVDPENKLHFRGARIFKAIMDDLMGQGMQNAESAILCGSSAGGLATILNCDKFKSLFHNDARVKCVADGGFFINGKTISGASHTEEMYDRIVTIHGSAKNLPPSCTSIMKPSLCFFPQHVVQYVQTPLFIINSAYDSWQINNTLVPDYLDSQHMWDNCKKRISNCTYRQRLIIEGFGVEFLKAFEGLSPSYTRGYFITSCHSHGSITRGPYWFSANSLRTVLLNKTIAEAVADWFFERAGFQKYIDPYPCARDC